MAETLTLSNPGHLLPTMRGKVSGVVGHNAAATTWTIQCSVCFTCATGPLILAVNWCDFTADVNDHGYPTGAPLPYRRCDDCRKARKHPEPGLFDLKEA